MSLSGQLAQDLTAAMKGGDSDRVGVLRLMIAAFRNREIEMRKGGSSPELTDEEILRVLEKEAKKRKDSITLYTQAGRSDLRAIEEKELAIIASYLPKKLDRAEIEMIVSRVVESTKARDFGSVMNGAMHELRGRADGNLVSEVVREQLASVQ